MKNLKTLKEIQNEENFNTDKDTIHSYLNSYEELFSDLEDPSILEIGTQYGGFFSLLRKKFPDSVIHGVDIDPEVKIEGIFICDINEFSTDFIYDVIIDDGSHKTEDMLNAFDRLKNNFNKYYIIEDIQDEEQMSELLKLNPYRVIDLREVKNRYDDILIVFKK